MTAAAQVLAGLPLGSALVLGALVWCVGRVVAAVIESRTFERGVGARVDEVLHHLDAATTAVRDLGHDVLGELTDVGKTLHAVRDAVEQLGDRDGGAR